MKSRLTQTSALLTNDASVQSYHFSSTEVQTDSVPLNSEKDHDVKDISRFLKSVEATVIKNLNENLNSKAFQGLEKVLGMYSSSVSNVLTLNHAPLEFKMSVQDMSWNSSGSVVGVAYGKPDHEDWCSHKGIFCTWNVDRGRINPNKADQALDVGSCLMCIEYHPILPNLCAGGAFNGQIIIWDLSRTEDIEVCVSKNVEDGHHEPVTKLFWQVSSKSNTLLSLGMDGKVLRWEVKLSRYQDPELTLIQGFVITGSYIPRDHSTAPSNRAADIGGTAMSFSHEDESLFVVGTESGLVLKCSTLSTELPLDRGIKIQFRSPITLVYNSHNGPVYDVHFSPVHRNLFLTASTDGTIRLYNTLQPRPFQVLEPVSGYVFGVQWSPHRPLVFAAATANGSLLVYDLKKSRVGPVLQIPVNQTKSSVYSLAFNRQSDVLCTGDSKGTVKIWKLSPGLSSPISGEGKLLERIAASSYE